MTLHDLLIIRDLLRKTVVRGNEETLLIQVVDKLDSLIEKLSRPQVA